MPNYAGGATAHGNDAAKENAGLDNSASAISHAVEKAGVPLAVAANASTVAHSAAAATPGKKFLKEDFRRRLFAAIESGDMAAFEALLHVDTFEPNWRHEKKLFGGRLRWTPLQMAAYSGRAEMVRALVARGGDPELRDLHYGGTALSWAAFGNQPEAARVLVELGANVFVRNNQGRRPIDLVAAPHDPVWKGVLHGLIADESERNVELMCNLTAIYEQLTNLQDRNNWKRAELFMTLPSRVDYPDYYTIVKRPIAFEQIKRRINSGEYSVDTFAKDIELMFDNALLYNDDASSVAQNAHVLKTAANEAIGQLKASEDESRKAFEPCMDVQCAAQQPATQSDSAASTTINCDIGSAMHSHNKDAALNAVQRMPLPAQPLVDPILAGASLRFMTGGQTTTISFGFSCNVRACCLTLPRDAADLTLYPCLQASLGSEPQTPARIEAVMVNQRKVFPELTQTLQFRLSLTNIGYGMHTVVELQCAVDASASIPRRFQIVLIQV